MLGAEKPQASIQLLESLIQLFWVELQTSFLFCFVLLQSFQGDLICSWKTNDQREPLEVPKLKVVFAEDWFG